MTTVAPPPHQPAVVRLGDNSPLRRVHFRLWQILMTAITVLVTAWLFRISIAAGIVALFFAKHVLVAVLAAGLSLPPAQNSQRSPSR